MSEQTGKAIEVQRQRVNDLHLRRGEEVRLAREIREQGRAGETDPDLNAAWREDYDAQWEKVEELTEQITLAELELKALERDNPVGQLLEALDMIAELPFFDAEAGVTTEQLVTQYDFARETARLAVACYERVTGEVANG